MATDKKKFARPSDSMIAQLKDMIQKYGPKAKVYDPDALEAARAAVKEPQNYGADEFRIIMADLKAAAAQNFAVEDRFYFKGKKEKFESPKNKILAELKDLLAMLKQVKADRDDIAIVSDSIKFVEKSKSSSEIGQVYRNAMDIEGQYFSRSGEKAKMARNPEFDTDEVKNILHKESSDAEWGIDREVKGRGFYTYNAYHAYIGEPVVTKRFNTRGEAEKWLEKQNAARHPNKRELARPGEKAKFAWQPEINAKIRQLNAAIESSQERLREATKLGKWNNAASICKNVGSMYSGNNGLASHYAELQEAADKEWRSK